MTDDGYELGNGMVMTLARIADITPRPDGFLRLQLHAPLIARMRPRGLAPVFKIFTARTSDAPLTLPVFDEHRLALPSWESDPARPIARAYTALDFHPGTEHLTFDALDLGVTDGWLHRARTGDTVGLIGFKHELVLGDDTEHVLLIGDRSARPAIEEILRSVPEGLRTTVLHLEEHPWEARIRAALDDADERTTVWIAGELQQVAFGRETALARGVAPARVVSLPYWHRGLSREHYDRALYRRYQRALAAGASITDQETVERIELTPLSADERQHA